MDEPGFWSSARIAILGLGLMGGSLALALQGKCDCLVGADPLLSARELAAKGKVVEKVSGDPSEILHMADVIILAAPVKAIISLINELPELYSESAIVLDLGSTKRQIINAMQGLPGRFDPIGGHPMCGKEKSSLLYAEASLFRGTPFVLTPLENTSNRARTLAKELVLAIGAVPIWLDAYTHDLWTAYTSHLPYLLASALAICTPTDAAALIGPGFRSTARISISSPDMMLDILATNRDNILARLKLYREQVQIFEELLEKEDYFGLKDLLEFGANNYRQLKAG
jgi:prephenate dehydrogenase